MCCRSTRNTNDKPGEKTVIFTAAAVQGGGEGFQKLVESDKVDYRIFKENIA